MRYAIRNIAGFSTVPLQFTTVILLILFVGSALMTSLGIIDYYIAKIYEESEQRLVYIVPEIVATDKI